MGHTRSAPDVPDTSDDDSCQGSGKKLAELDQAEMRNKKLRRDGDARNLSREKRQMRVILLQIEEMEHTEAAGKAGPWSTHLA